MSYTLLLLASFVCPPAHAVDAADEAAILGRVSDPELATLLMNWNVCGSRCFVKLYPTWAAEAQELAAKLQGSDAVDAVTAAWELERLAGRRACQGAVVSPMVPHEVLLFEFAPGRASRLGRHQEVLRNLTSEGMVLQRAKVEEIIAEFRAVAVVELDDGSRVATFNDSLGNRAGVEVDGALLEEAARFVVFMEKELLPVSRAVSTVTPSCYLRRIHEQYGEELDPHSLHLHALEQLRENRARTLERAGLTLGRHKWDEVRVALMAPTFESEDELMAFAREAVFDSAEHMPHVAGDLSLPECGTGPGETWAGMYRTDDKGPGGWWEVDVLAPAKTPRVLVRSIGAHECWPGHHMQKTVENASDLPRFRSDIKSRAFTEGWATYAESIPSEHGYLRSPLEEMGPLVMDAWRTTRVLVDTGVNFEGWTLEQAGAAYREWTIMPEHQIERELETIVQQPAFLLAHKVGADELRTLRVEAEAKLGEAFDARDLHLLLLREGELPVPAMRKLVREWLAGRIQTPMVDSAPVD